MVPVVRSEFATNLSHAVLDEGFPVLLGTLNPVESNLGVSEALHVHFLELKTVHDCIVIKRAKSNAELNADNSSRRGIVWGRRGDT